MINGLLKFKAERADFDLTGHRGQLDKTDPVTWMVCFAAEQTTPSIPADQVLKLVSGQIEQTTAFLAGFKVEEAEQRGPKPVEHQSSAYGVRSNMKSAFLVSFLMTLLLVYLS